MPETLEGLNRWIKSLSPRRGVVMVGHNGGDPLEAQTVESGTYTPTLTNVANLDASTAFACQYLRVGNVVTVSGTVDADATAGGGTTTQLGISLPIASAFASNLQCAGVGTEPTDQAQIYSDAANDRAEMRWNATVTANTTWRFTFTYLVV